MTSSTNKCSSFPLKWLCFNFEGAMLLLASMNSHLPSNFLTKFLLRFSTLMEKEKTFRWSIPWSVILMTKNLFYSVKRRFLLFRNTTTKYIIRVGIDWIIVTVWIRKSILLMNRDSISLVKCWECRWNTNKRVKRGVWNKSFTNNKSSNKLFKLYRTRGRRRRK